MDESLAYSLPSDLGESEVCQSTLIKKPTNNYPLVNGSVMFTGSVAYNNSTINNNIVNE